MIFRFYPTCLQARSCWSIQPGGESNLAGDRITYVQTALENLPQTVEEETGRKLAILCADAPILWQQAHTLYQRAAVRLEDIRSESGMMVLDTAEELRHSDGEAFLPQHGRTEHALGNGEMRQH